MTTTLSKLITCFSLLFISLNPTFAQTPSYHFIKKISLPTGDGKWDYLKIDDNCNRLYVSHADRIHIVDLKTELQIGEIAGLKGVHGVALAEEMNKGYISNGADNAITIFDLETFKVLKTITVEGKKADAIMYDKASKQVFVFNNGSGNAVVIDAKTDTVVAKVEMGGAPEFAVSNEKGSVFNNNEDSNEIFEIDTKTNTIKNKYPLAPAKVPTGLAFDAQNNRLFSVCRDPQMLVVVDATNGKIIQTLPIGKGTDAAVYDKDLKLIMASNGEGNVTIVQQETADKYTIIQTLTTQTGLKTMALNAKTHQIYLSGADYEADKKTLVKGTFGVYVYGLKVN